MGSMALHLQTQHGKSTGGRRNWCNMPPGGEPRIYKMAFPATGGARNYLVEGCRGRAATWTEIRVHFLHRHVQDTVIILEEGNLPHIWCRRFNMLVP